MTNAALRGMLDAGNSLAWVGSADRRPNRGWVTRAVEDRGTEGRGAYRWRVPGLSVLVR